MNAKKENVQLLINDLIAESHKNQNFKENLIANPKTTIEEFTNFDVKITKDIHLCVEDQTQKDIIYLNIPRRIDLDDIELTQEELETVSGGSTGGCVATGVAAWFVADYIDGFYNGIKDRLK